MVRCRRVPGRHVHAVGYVPHRHFALRPTGKERRENVPAHPAVQLAYAIDRPAPAHRQVRHVEGLVRVIGILASQRQQFAERKAELFLRITAEVLLHQCRRENVKSSRDRRVGGKKIARARGRQGNGKRLSGLLHETPGTLQEGEGGMPFVEMADVRFDSERREQPPAADPEHHFLFQAQFRSTAIQFVGDAAMHGKIGRVVRVEKVEREPANLNLPGAKPDGVTGQHDLQPQALAIRKAHRGDGQLSGIVIRIKCLLRSISVDHLAEIAMLVEQADGDDRHAEIAGGFELIAGHIAQAARIDREGFAQHEFHAEIGDAGERDLGVLLLKPAGFRRRLPLGLHQAVEQCAKVPVGQGTRELFARDGLKDHIGMMRELPEHRIEPPPQLIGTVIPRPAQVHGQFSQCGKTLRRVERRGTAGCGCAHGVKFIREKAQFGSPSLRHAATAASSVSSRGAAAARPATAFAVAASVALTMVWASSKTRRKWVSPRKLSA